MRAAVTRNAGSSSASSAVRTIVVAIGVRVVDINALRALAPIPRAPTPRPSRPQPRTPQPRWRRRHSGLVSVLTLEGERLAQWGDPSFRSCHGIWGDSRGDLYVVRPGAWGRGRRVVKHVRVR